MCVEIVARHVTNTFWQEPKYTASSKSKRLKQSGDVAKGKSGIGWSEEGMKLYNELYDLVVADRNERGPVFNNELLNVFVERRRQRKLKPNALPAFKKQRVIPKDDLASFDTAFVNVLGSQMIPEYHASMKL